MDVRTLTAAYRKANTMPGREDARHAKWWAQELEEAAATLTAARLLESLDRLGRYGRSPSTVAKYLRFLRRVCAWGTLVGYLPTDPSIDLGFPKQPRPSLRVLKEDEEASLCAALGPPYALWVKLAIETGLKQSEQFTLRWRDVDVDRATVLLPHQPTGAVSLLHLTPKAVAILQQLRALHPPSLWVFPDLQNPFRPVNIHAFYVGRWVSAVNRSKIPWVAWRDLRHTCGVRLSQQGVPIDEIVRRMRQRETKRAFMYRALASGRGLTPKAATLPREPVFPELSDGELQAVMMRDLSAQPLTFGEAARLYAVHHLGNRPTRIQFDRMFLQFWQPWGERRLDSLTRREVRAWYVGLAKTPGQANKALTLLRSLYNWAFQLELVTVGNPAVGIRRFRAESRERFLSLDEIKRAMGGLPHLSLKPRAYLLVLLFTGARRSEARLMKWSDIDEESRLWKKPRTKNGTSHMVPLPAQVIEALHDLPRTGVWIFPGQNGNAWSTAMVDKMWATIRRRWGLDDVTLHDLRRTTASYLAMEGENLPTIQAVLNHRSLTPTSIYARLNVKAVDRALQAQANRLCSLASPVPALTFAPEVHHAKS